jgi:hypothetical protein
MHDTLGKMYYGAAKATVYALYLLIEDCMVRIFSIGLVEHNNTARATATCTKGTKT